MNIVIANRQRVKKINLRLLQQTAAALLAELKMQTAELEIVLLGAAEMTRLNETFLRHEGPTDVITFDYLEKRKAEGGKRKRLHGEIFICVDEAVLQAKQFKTTWQSELVRYLVHGVLHLLGFDDSRTAARQKMKRRENLLLRKLAGKFRLAETGGRSKLRA
jgi:probable rRNA maturation factor